MKRIVICLAGCVCGVLGPTNAAPEPASPVAGGVTFRTDDNGPNPDYFRQRAAVFDKYGLKFGAAVNPLQAENQPGMIEVFKEIQAGGHDIMDHTPTHSNTVMMFASEADLAWVQGQPGVDHVDKKTVFLRCDFQVPPADRESRNVNVNGNRLTPVSADGAERWFKDQEYLYFPTLKIVCRINSREAADGVYPLATLWQEDIDLETLTDTPVQRLATHEVLPTDEGIALLAQTVRRVCDRQGLKYPVTYIAPGNSPHLTPAVIKRTYGEKFGYRSAAAYPLAAKRVFNEPDPDGTAPFGMQWGDVTDEVPGSDLASLQNRIANLLAINKVVIVGSHVLGDPKTWPAYFEKMDALLAWLQEKNIPVKSHAEWSDILYRSGKQLTGNIFPAMDRDLDGDGKPDGYELVNAAPSATPSDASLPEKQMLTANKPGVMFRVQALGGLPHGEAELSCWLSGPLDTTVNVMVHGVGPISFKLKEGWNQYTAPITVPANVATARVDFNWASKQEGVVSVCGIALK